jgi:hypothetical protein
MRVVLPLAVLALLAACASDNEGTDTALNSSSAPAVADAGSDTDSNVAH